MKKNNFIWLALIIFAVVIDFYFIRAPLISILIFISSILIFIWQISKYFYKKSNKNLISIFKPSVLSILTVFISWGLGYAMTSFMEKKANEKLAEVLSYYEIHKINPPTSQQSFMGYMLYYFNSPNSDNSYIRIDVYNWQRKVLNIKTQTMSEASD
jgi:hypothetical protein